MILISCIASFSSLHAEAKSYTSQYLMSYPITIEKAVTSPLHWQTKDFMVAGSIVAIGTGLYFYDEDITDWVQDHREGVPSDVVKVGNFLGNGKYILPAAGVVWLGGYAVNSDKTRDTGLLLIKSMLIAGGATNVLKYATQRNRPQEGKGKEFWLPGGFSRYRESFPSGHATIAFSVASVVSEQYKDVFWVPIVAYSGATLTCYSRVHDLKHWSSDVFIGSCIGYFTGKLVMKTTPMLEVSPSLQGVGFLYKF